MLDERMMTLKDRVLKYLIRNKGSFVSGEKISESLGISRAAVWKHISSLRQDGFEIDSASRRGYMLIGDADIINPQIISDSLRTSFIGKKIIYMDSIGSTNDHIKSIAGGSTDGTVVIANEQTKGKGRMGRYWHSQKGDGIWMSMLLKPHIAPNKASIITQIAGAAIVKALDEFGVSAMIKWPNDIILNGKKLCGILTEMAAEIDRINYIVLGMGMNVKSDNFPDEISDIATSLYKEGHAIKRADIIRSIFENFERLYVDYIKNDDLKEVVEICRERSAVIGKDIYVITWSEKKKARALDISQNGDLLVEYKDGRKESLVSGEVSIRKADDE
ncbi:biotin--[acetyl-CoA-carboxylase] ligase [Peptoclostridium litorale]|uniref:biotin--[acetyl-CoA-carboxylase] ligase n=1 Tax=Peptoclostridium litorale TaxID=1557 RepID=UPI001FA8E6BE|nr:biotin--[acetyl-CoA-carboxylase] ligase [Peptoclostridium litorale]